MIAGIGTDIVQIARMTALWDRHGASIGKRLLAPAELPDLAAASDKGRFLSKRFAAKEALGKALGTGIRAPVLLTAIAIAHDDLGKPMFQLDPPLAAYLEERHLEAHLSLSDERDYAIAFVIVEQP